jgi:D-amino peptidase
LRKRAKRCANEGRVNVYISCDMEGTAGVCSWKQCDPSDAHEYPVFRRYMTREVRAAIEGARNGGARTLTVNDSHWSMHNLLLDELPADADLRVISGAPKPWSMMQGLNSSVDAAFFTGYHAKAGDCATLAHTFSDSIYSVAVNGKACSEALLNAALAGSYGVPVVLITGDRSIVDEAARELPWAVGVAVKDAIGFSAVNSLTPQAACDAIRAGAQEAMGRIAQARPFVFDSPFELSIETADVEHADFIELMPGFKRIGGRAVRFNSDRYPALLEAFIAATRIAAAANPIA